MRLKHILYLLRAYYSVLSKDLNAKFPLAISRKLVCWKNGFLAEKYVLYDLENNSYRNYLSDIHASMARWINDPYTAVLSNKFLFEAVVGSSLRVPKTIGLILNGKISCWSEDAGKHDWGEVMDLCQSDPIILKPVVGGGGRGIMLVTAAGDEISVNGESMSIAAAIAQFEKLNDYLVMEYAAQGDFPQSLNPTTTNTMRVVTLFDDDIGIPFMASAVQRIGNKKSAPYDNFTKGGLSALIDLQTGRLGQAASHPDSMTLHWHKTHPDTGKQIEGRVVPRWEDIKDQVLDAASHISYLKCIGWDLMLTDDGVCAIEGNHHPDPDVLQCHGGLLHDARVRRFYERHAVIG